MARHGRHLSSLSKWVATCPVSRSHQIGEGTGIDRISCKGRGVGERLVVDPNKNSVLFFGARSGHGLWKSTDSGVTWTQVTSLPNTGETFDGAIVAKVITFATGTYVPDPTDTSGYNSDPIGVAWVTFDSTSGSSGTATPRVFVGVVSNGTNNVFVSNDAGSTCKASILKCMLRVLT